MPEAAVERVAESLAYVHDVLASHGIWHAVVCGTLLGAVRDQDVIAWDHDFDLLARGADRQRIVALTEVVEADGYAFKYAVLPATQLAVVPEGCERFNASAVVVFRDGAPIGDIITPWLFEDGILRSYDVGQNVYWCPRNSFPHWFVDELAEVTLRGVPYPAPRAPERWLEAFYGADWRVPYRCVQKGGEARPGMTALGDLAAPSLDALVSWCLAQGWDRGAYAGLPPWPQPVCGAGPSGDGGLGHGWASIDELITRY